MKDGAKKNNGSNLKEAFRLQEGGDAMILLCDTRQQEGKHKNIDQYCKRHGLEMVKKCLSVGDYAFPGGKISVDTKQDL